MSNLRKRFGWLLVLSAASYLFSFGNQLVVSFHLGTSASLDGYWTLLSMASFMMFYVQPLREALIPPVFVAASSDKERAWALYSAGVAVQAIIAGILIALTLLAPKDFIARLGLGSTLPKEILLSFLPYFLLYALAETCNGLLLSFNHVVYQATARLISAAIGFLFLFLLAGKIGVLALLGNLLITQIITLVVSIMGLHREGVKLVWRGFAPLWDDPRFLPMFYSLLISSLFAHFYVLFERMTMLHMGAGLVASFQYSTAVVNVGISMIVFPVRDLLWPQFLSRHSRGDIEGVLLLTAKTLVPLCLALGAGCAFVYSYGLEITHLIYSRGEFDANSVSITSDALRATVFTALPIAVYALYERVLLATGQGRSLVISRVVLTVGGMSVITFAAAVESVALVRWHWFIGNFCGALMIVAFMVFRYKPMRQMLGCGLIWSLKALAVVLVALTLLPPIDPVTNKSTLVIELLVRFGLLMVLLVILSHIFKVLDLREIWKR